MPTICPHCPSVRPANAQAPDWQCPSCGKAYAKAGSSTASVRPTSAARAAHSSAGAGIPWVKLVLGAAIAYGAWAGWHKLGGADGISRASHFGGNASVEQWAQLAASRQASDVLMYSAAWCPNCSAAKGWMGQYGFKYEECDIDKDSTCMSALRALDPQGGVPYLIVRGQHMKDGFDSEQFLVALAK
jgi:glutaredoxin